MGSFPLLPNPLLGDRGGRRLFVALGDSFTEGVGDRDQRLPNGVRGWADRVAEKLAKAEPGWEYANLAIRSKRLRHVIGEQLEPALAMEPTLVTLYAGGNDILDFGTDMDVPDGRTMSPSWPGSPQREPRWCCSPASTSRSPRCWSR